MNKANMTLADIIQKLKELEDGMDPHQTVSIRCVEISRLDKGKMYIGIKYDAFSFEG